MAIPFTSGTPRAVGRDYLVTSAVMLLLAFLLVLLIRWQLAYPETAVPGLAGFFDGNHPWMPGGVLMPRFYNQLAGMHGTIMVFFAIVPLLVGALGNALVPSMIGAQGFALPGMARASWWCFVVGIGLTLYSFFAGDGPASTGWTAYAPLSSVEPAGQTWWLLGIAGVYLSSLLLSINLIATIVQCRRPGMGFMQMPYFVWSQLVTCFLLLLAFPPLAAAAALQLMDRLAGSNFFVPTGLVVDGSVLPGSGGGSALLWQHLFWFLAHPEVYVILLPAIGIVMEIYYVHGKAQPWSYRSMVGATLLLGFLSMLVWAHHMFLTGMGATMNAFFQTTSVIVSLPSIMMGMGLLMTLWNAGRIRYTAAMCYALAFLPMFALGGFTGIPLALAATNVPLHDTNYVVGHFHLIAAPGTLFAIFAALHHWFPKFTGRTLNETLGKLHCAISLVGMTGVFGAMLLQGLAGVNRRLYDGGMTYAHAADVHWLQKAATHSAFLLAAAQLLFLFNLAWTLSRAKNTAANPWDAEGSDWKPEDELLPAPASTTTLPQTGFHTLRLATLLLIAASAMFFGALFSSYVFLREAAAEWPVMTDVVWWPLVSLYLAVIVGLFLFAWWSTRKSAALSSGIIGIVATFAVNLAAPLGIGMIALQLSDIFGRVRSGIPGPEAYHNAYAYDSLMVQLISLHIAIGCAIFWFVRVRGNEAAPKTAQYEVTTVWFAFLFCVLFAHHALTFWVYA
ncbi:MAG: cytochrome C oxidase subunit I [Candidatus Hydrogenedens sp.]|nr:cytochrome C oxidase subunit I [Candidatus Hydrogenedens sp.]